jgi:hypothetical protein
VVYGCEGGLHFDLLVEIFGHCVVKVFCVVNYDLSRNTISANNVLPEEPFDSSRAYVHDGLRLNPLHEVFDCHNGRDVVALC